MKMIKIVSKKQWEEAHNLISMLDSFIFVARTDDKQSKAVDFAADAVQKYKRDWNWRNK